VRHTSCTRAQSRCWGPWRGSSPSAATGQGETGAPLTALPKRRGKGRPHRPLDLVFFLARAWHTRHHPLTVSTTARWSGSASSHWRSVSSDKEGRQPRQREDLRAAGTERSEGGGDWRRDLRGRETRRDLRWTRRKRVGND
jgi:hypothetical protein